MPVFRCLIRGENFPGSLACQAEPVGFYTTRWVEAESPAEAEGLAVGLLREDPTLNSVAPEQRTEDAQVYFESIEEVLPEPGRGSGTGFTFFPMGS
ncbi:hypothetical protein [Cognatiluteimonas telluris]|uniref:hypothetical protein n=1 Tax=Cognatiluteimonas telluris TaxID=1104775 RepID=UPI00140ACA00|nr:hypothetical protein [Lysobacter telluris]